LEICAYNTHPDPLLYLPDEFQIFSKQVSYLVRQLISMGTKWFKNETDEASLAVGFAFLLSRIPCCKVQHAAHQQEAGPLDR
jgi:hypothetical protein